MDTEIFGVMDLSPVLMTILLNRFKYIKKGAKCQAEKYRPILLCNDLCERTTLFETFTPCARDHRDLGRVYLC